MKLNIAPIQDKMIMCRFTPPVYNMISKLAKEHKTSRAKIIKALIEKQLEEAPKH